MSRVVFLGLNAYGHINPTLSIVKELISRGEEVVYIVADKYKDLITTTGCSQTEFKYSRFLFGSHHLKMQGRRSEDEFLESVKQFYESIEYQMTLANKLKQLINSLKPDYIIHDSTLFYIKYICNELCVPCISSVTLFAMNEKMFVESERLLSDFYNVNLKNSSKYVVNCIKEIGKEYSSKYGFVHNYFDNSMTKQGLNIVYTSKKFQPYNNLLDASYNFAGNNLMFRKLIEKKDEIDFLNKQKKVLVSFGSIMSDKDELVEFYNNMMNYFRKYDATFILNIGKLKKNMFDNIPDNFILKNGISQLQLLEVVDLFITHGGMNSVSEALQLNTPMIVIPQVMDQFIVADQVEKNGMGEMLNHTNINFAELEDMISKILSSPTYINNIECISKSYRETGEEKTAVDKIFEFVGK